jgi:hypothetical protein
MELAVNDPAVQGVLAQIQRQLYRHGTRLAQDALNRLRDEVLEDMALGGTEALEGIRTTVTDFARENAGELGSRAFQWTQSATNGLQDLWRQNQNDWSNILRTVREGVEEGGNRLHDTEVANARGELREVVPDLSGLIPENDGRDTGMNRGNEDGDVEMAAARAVGGGGGLGMPSKETPISQYPSLTYGLQNTHTTIIPWRTWFSVSKLDKFNVLQTNFRMNSIYDMMVTDITALTNGGTTPTKGVYNRPINTSGANVTDAVFPVTPTGGSQAGERGQWRDYWAQLYKFYTIGS